MAFIFGEQYTKKELCKRVGDMSQIASVRESILTAGKSNGVKALDVKNAGINFTVLPSRGMDIAQASYNGTPLSFISRTGIVSPAYYEADGFGFLKSFTAGLLTTCGLSSMGMPSIDEGESYGLHGRISNIPAQDVSVYQEWENDEFVMKIRGKVREGETLGKGLCLTREITTKLGSASMSVRDYIENETFASLPLMMIYHINFGFPIVGKDTVFYAPKANVSPRDADAKAGLSNYDRFENPYNAKEQMFFHDFENKTSDITACLFNEKLKLGVYVTYDPTQLNYFGEWKMMGQGDYVVAFEPGTWLPLGRAEARKRNELKYIEPGEKMAFGFELGVIESEEQLSRIQSKISK